MKHIASRFAYTAGAFLLPALALAQTSGGGGSGGSTGGSATFNGSALSGYMMGIINFINSFVVPFIFAIAFIVFIWGIFQYFIAGGANEEQRDKGKQFAVWGIIGFFIMLTLWGIVNLLTTTSGLRDQNNPNFPKFEVRQ